MSRRLSQLIAGWRTGLSRPVLTLQAGYYVGVSGYGRVRLDDEIRDLRCWDVVRVDPATVRAFEAGEGCVAASTRTPTS